MAQQLNWDFEDLDAHIEQQQGCTIAEIFMRSGEEAFRRIEQQVLRQVLDSLRDSSGKVVALGGGAFAQAEAHSLLKGAGLHSIFLEAPVDELWRRCCRQMEETGIERPLLRSLDEFRRLYQSRQNAYSKADITVSTRGRAVEDIASEISRALGVAIVENKENVE